MHVCMQAAWVGQPPTAAHGNCSRGRRTAGTAPQRRSTLNQIRLDSTRLDSAWLLASGTWRVWRAWRWRWCWHLATWQPGTSLIGRCVRACVRACRSCLLHWASLPKTIRQPDNQTMPLPSNGPPTGCSSASGWALGAWLRAVPCARVQVW
jgi:hypothetical protein